MGVLMLLVWERVIGNTIYVVPFVNNVSPYFQNEIDLIIIKFILFPKSTSKYLTVVVCVYNST